MIPPPDDPRAFAVRLVEAQEEERARIARELHDDVVQHLGLIVGEVARLRESLSDPVAAARRVAGLEAELVDLCEQVRRVAHRTHPTVLDHLGLAPALRVLAEDLEASGRLKVDLSADADLPTVAPVAALALYRVVQEALRNVIRHAASGTATIVLEREAGGLRVEVSDSGRGFDTGAASVGAGLGLRSMNERLRLAGGTVRIVSAPGSGTQVIAWVPGDGA